MGRYANEFEQFAEESRARYVLWQGGQGDFRPGKLWSKPFNDSTFLLAVQRVKPDDWCSDENMMYWEFLHVGGDLPH